MFGDFSYLILYTFSKVRKVETWDFFFLFFLLGYGVFFTKELIVLFK